MLETSASGRGFLQEHGLRFPNTPGHSNYFAALKSPRRREVIREVNLALVAAANATLHDRLADIPELATGGGQNSSFRRPEARRHCKPCRY